MAKGIAAAFVAVIVYVAIKQNRQEKRRDTHRMDKNEIKAADSGGQQDQSRDSEQNRPTATTPLNASKEPAQHLDKEQRERAIEAVKRCWQHRNPRIWDFRFSSVSQFLFSIALIGVGVFQYLVYNQQANDNRIFQRPFVYLSGLQALYQDSASGPVIRINPVWGNSGNTPTADLKIYASWNPTSGLLPREYSFPDLNAAGEEVTDVKFIKTFLPPKVNVLGSDKVVTDPQMQAINSSNGDKILWGWGWARYKDQFQHSYVTRFCVAIGRFIIPTKEQFSAPGGAAGGSMQWKFCDQGNCADDECKKQ